MTSTIVVYRGAVAERRIVSSTIRIDTLKMIITPMSTLHPRSFLLHLKQHQRGTIRKTPHSTYIVTYRIWGIME